MGFFFYNPPTIPVHNIISVDSRMFNLVHVSDFLPKFDAKEDQKDLVEASCCDIESSLEGMRKLLGYKEFQPMVSSKGGLPWKIPFMVLLRRGVPISSLLNMRLSSPWLGVENPLGCTKVSFQSTERDCKDWNGCVKDRPTLDYISTTLVEELL